MKAGAKYLIGDNGEKIVVLSKQQEEQLEYKKRREIQEKEYREWEEEKKRCEPIFKLMVTKHLSEDMRKFFEKKKLLYTGTIRNYDALQPEAEVFLEKLRLNLLEVIQNSEET